MANNQLYLAMSEDAIRGTPVATYGFLPILGGDLPTFEPDDKPRLEFRGEETALGDRYTRRMSTKWSYSPEIPFFTEAGTTKGMMGTILKHFFGLATSAQNGGTGQYYHMMYPMSDPFKAANLGTKSFTLYSNISAGTAAVKAQYFKGGRISGLTFKQEVGQILSLTPTMFGTTVLADQTAIATPAFAAENLRCNYNNLKAYYGAPTRTGTAPDYTEFASGTAVQASPDSLSISITNLFEDKIRLSGLAYADKTTLGKYAVEIEMGFDWDDPAAGFSSYDDYVAWLGSTGESTTNFFYNWDTGTIAGTAGADNHGLILDIPRCQRMGNTPSFTPDRDPLTTIKYKGEFDAATTEYICGCMLKNSATSI